MVGILLNWNFSKGNRCSDKGDLQPAFKLQTDQVGPILSKLMEDGEAFSSTVLQVLLDIRLGLGKFFEASLQLCSVHTVKF